MFENLRQKQPKGRILSETSRIMGIFLRFEPFVGNIRPERIVNKYVSENAMTMKLRLHIASIAYRF